MKNNILIDLYKRTLINTLWCLIGCSIGDFGTILFFQLTEIPWPVWSILTLAIVNGILTSILLETIILSKQLPFKLALKTAAGMSLISMITMEAVMNAIDFVVTGGAELNWFVIPLMLIAGYIAPLPYNYIRLRKFGKSCH
ncbi:MAG TPA: DUF4396 domain-containing protein [Candidatus Marinimicrobia bacterium]|nr:DUF4396 domain-containing protein [Candidatus Neomarinimicrobiota bacterium]